MMRILADYESLSQAAAEMVMQEANIAIGLRGVFNLVLSGGETPRRTYELLAEDRFKSKIPWDRFQVFWGDERCVPLNDPRKNERMAREVLLNRVPIPPNQIHPINCEGSPEHAALDYESFLRTYFEDHSPRFDLVLLGLGNDGHTASLFPGSKALREDKRWVAESKSSQDHLDRVSLTTAIINRASMVIFLVSGKDKAEIFRKAIAQEIVGDPLPARLIRPSSGQLIWLVDKKAAGISN
jgi:6-phosphogluconolactonase